MGISEFFNFKAIGGSEVALPEIYPFNYKESDFVKTDCENIYNRILTDVLERTQGIPADKQALFWDNCVASESFDGLVTLIAKAMVAKAELFIVYDKAINLVRKADQAESKQIKSDYEKANKSSVGVFISFKNYTKTDFLKIYSALEYCSIASLYKSMNLSKAVQVKVSDLRGSVALLDKAAAEKQAVAIAEGLSKGVDVLLDAKDSIESHSPDLTATKESMNFIAEKRSFYLGLPASYITGLAPKGLGDSGEGDAKAVERGLKNYYFAIIKPVVEAIFGITTSFKSEDFRQLSTSLEALKTFELTGDELIGLENKKDIVAKLFGFEPEKKKKTDIEIVGAPGGKVQDSALNGAQVSSLVDIISRVALKEIPAESAIAIVEKAYLLDTTEAQRLVNPAKNFTPKINGGGNV